MIPYLILLFTVTMIAYLGRSYNSKGVRFISLVIIFLLLTMFAGLRHRLVGTDTGTYVHYFVNDIWRASDVGYNILMATAKILSSNYAALLTLIAVIVVGCYTVTIVRLTKHYETALFLFITLGAYTFFFNGARQGIAAAICFFAIPWLLERKQKQYFLFISLAFLFHKTALIAVPLYFLAAPRIGWRQIVGIIIGIVILFLSLSVFVQFAAAILDDKYANYANKTEGGGYVKVSFLVFQGMLLYWLRPKSLELDQKYNRLLNIYLIGLIPAIVAVISNVNPSGLLRLSLYFSTVSIVLWPVIFSSWKNDSKKVFILFLFVLFAMLYYYLTISTFSNLLPYKLNTGFV